MTDESIKRYLMAGEQLIWWGQPKQGFLLTPRDVFLIPFSLLWGGFAIFWETGVAGTGAPFFFLLWGVPFVLMGLYAILGRFFVDAWIRSRTVYGLTDKRVLIVRGSPIAKFLALNLAQLPSVEINEGRNARGTIRFGSGSFFNNFGSMGFGVWMPSLDATPQFLGIDDALAVFDQIQKLKAAS
jgi:hypothetical protein